MPSYRRLKKLCPRIAPISETEDVGVVEESDDQFFGGWDSLNDHKNMPEVNMKLWARDHEVNEDGRAAH